MSDKIETKADAEGRRALLISQLKARMASDADITEAQYDEVKLWNKELDAIAGLIKVFNEEEEARVRAETGGEPAAKQDMEGFTFDMTEWNALHSRGGVEGLKGRQFDIDVSKFLFDAPTTRSTWGPESTRFRGPVLDPLREPSLLDALPKIQSNQMAAVYVRQTAQTNTVAKRAENVAAVEQEFAATEISTTIPMVSAYTEVTGEEIADEATIMSIIRNRLPLLARVAVDADLVTDAMAVTGINAVTTAATEARVVKLLDGITDIGSKVFTPADLVVTNLKTYSAVRKIRTTQGVYYFGGPEADGVRSFWGVPVVINHGMTNHEALAFASRAWTAVVLKGGAKIYVTDSHGTNFIKNVFTLRVDLPALGLWYHAKAITNYDITLGNDTGYAI